MGIEVVPLLGQIRAADVRLVLGRAAPTANHVDVLVLAKDGGIPFVGRIELTQIPGGPGQHLALRCPQCDQPRNLLLADGRGGIACAQCARARTRRQQARTCRAWNRLGEREVDALVRLLRPRVAGDARRYDRALGLIDEILAGDADRLGAVVDVAAAALSVA